MNTVNQLMTAHERTVIPAHCRPKHYPARKLVKIKTYDLECVDIIISLAVETRDFLEITPQAALIDDDLGPIGRMVSCRVREENRNCAKAGTTPTEPLLPAKPVALSPELSKSKPTSLPKPSPMSGLSTLVNRTTDEQKGSSLSGPSGSWPWRNLQPGEDSKRSSVKLYASNSTALSVSETSRTEQWHESDLPVDHDPAPVAHKDIMYKPGAPTSYEELVQFINEQIQPAENTMEFNRCIQSTHYVLPDDGDIISPYQLKNWLLTADTLNLACAIAEIGGRLFSAFYTAPETISMNDSDMDILYDFKVEDIENMKQNNTDFDNMAGTEHTGDTGNDIESQALKNETITTSMKTANDSDTLADLMKNEICEREHMEESCQTLGITIENRTFMPLKPTNQLHPHWIVADDLMVEKENRVEQGGLLADDCGTGRTLTALALICHQVNMYEQLLKQQPSGLEQWQIKLDDIKARDEKCQKVKKAPPKPCWEVHLPTSIL
ncbi:hypothetical protein BDD12DRAFT_802946 [Trichophaea hybrida]|nr:hypothetical protein BDD12DRAFT_802946 [Trichophaea hybrida]